MKNPQYLLALHTIDGLGPIRLRAIVDFFEDLKLGWLAERGDLLKVGIPEKTIVRLLETRKTFSPDKYLENLNKMGISWISIYDEDYPYLLSQIYDPPTVLYFRGEIKETDSRAIAVVGTRKITGYGRMVTEQFTNALATCGLTIISGLARGVDSLAHWTAVKVGGRTIAVLGGGVNNIYPPENLELSMVIAEGAGAVLSEFPPDYPALPGNFPARNRIISGLSKAVLVTEAAVDSGSLITARVAIEQGREVFAIPGPINSNLSQGPLDLIKEGARLVSSPEEILEEFGLVGGAKFRAHLLVDLSENEKKVLKALEGGSLQLDEIVRLVGLSPGIVAGSLIKMEISGLVRNLGNGVYCQT